MKCLMVMYPQNLEKKLNYLQADLIADLIAVQISKITAVPVYQGIFVDGGAVSAEIAGRLAAKLNRRCLTEVQRMERRTEGFLVHKAVYNYNMEAAFLINEPFVAAFSKKWQQACKELRSDMGSQLDVQEILPPKEEQPNYAADRRKIQERAKNSESEVLLAAGKGVRSKEDIAQLRSIAENKGWGFGVSRPVAMNGWGRIDEIIGVSGHIYIPKICITVGISGSAAFCAGIENSQWIASVNTDAKAPMVRMSDVSLIEDYRNTWKWLEELC